MDPAPVMESEPLLIPSIPANARAGSVLVLDSHIVHASLHSPLPHWWRRDIGPCVLAGAVLVAQALPALLYEAQVWWIRAGEEEALPQAEVNDASLLDDAASVFADESPLADVANSTLTAAMNSTALPSAAQLQIDALSMPDSFHFYFMYALPLCGLLYALLWLTLYWNVRMQIWFRYRSHSSIADVRRAKCVRVEPVEHGGKSEICPLQLVRDPALSGGEELFFVFQKNKYIYHKASRESLEKAKSAAVSSSHAKVALPFSAYVSSSGLTDEGLKQSAQKYGDNVFDIPLPPFMDLFREHAMAPFFVFQILCVLLWCLDEYWVSKRVAFSE
jgi:hypothetical protein